MGVLIFLLFLVFVALSVPLASSLGLASVIYILVDGNIPGAVIPQRIFVGVDNFTLLAIPLFILTGQIMDAGGISRRLIRLASALVGSLKGGLGLVTVVATMFFSGITGSVSADTAAIGSIMIPAMAQKGYSPERATAIVTAACSVGILIPPSLTMIILAAVTNLSVGALFLAGLVPALIVGFGLMGIIYVQARRGKVPSEQKTSLAEIGTAFREAVLALLTPVIIMGGILGGIFTATESAAIAVVYSLIISMFVYRQIKVRDLLRILGNSAVMAALVLFLVGAASLFGWIIARERLTVLMANWLFSVSSSPWVFLMLVNLVFLFIGSILEGSPAIIILAPLLYPIAHQMGIDPIHFGIILIANLGVGFVLPPTGLCLVVATGIAKVNMAKMIRPLIPYFLVMAVSLLLITYVPWLAVALPRMTGIYKGR
jgi:C4-dicarboxylate transporter DctM subunit